jgi:hypothetical protein
MSLTTYEPKEIQSYRLIVLLHALKLECKGMKRKGPSAYSIVKQELGIKGSKQKVYNLLKADLEKKGIINS